MKEFAIEYNAGGDDLRVIINAKTLNEAIIIFAKNYHNIHAVWVVQEVVSLYRS